MTLFGQKTFRGGVHPPELKSATRDREIREAPLGARLVVSLRQSLGAASLPVVAAGQKVLKGEMIGRPGSFISAALHAPTSGAVKSLTKMLDPATGSMVDAIEIEPDGADLWHDSCNQQRDWRTMSPEEIRQAVADAGLVGLGGATFPTHVKLTPPKGARIETLILNGAECEPYLTCDHRLMLAHADEIVEGLEIFMRATGATRGLIGIEDNKPDAVAALSEAVKRAGLAKIEAETGRPKVEVLALAVKYPQGAEKQLIEVALGREVPSGGLPADVGAVVQNVATAKAACDALRWRRPLIERVMTITGDAVAEPANLRVRIGMGVAALLAAAGLDEAAERVIMGGPMMGLALASTETYIVKGLGGLVALRSPQEFANQPCIRCGRCVEVCPAGLVPSQLSVLGEAYEDHVLAALDEAMDHGLMDCIECGSCSFVCPAGRRIVHYIRFLKGERRKKIAKDRDRDSQIKAKLEGH